jgi:hypothetical protein
MFARWTISLPLAALTALVLSATGCAEKDKTSGQQAKAKIDKGKEEDKHAGWWCQEHGVPEHLCSLCLPDAEVKKKFKDQGDWCEIHHRAKSQCFKCDPSKYKEFEAMYVAKYGKKPERPDDDEFKK